MRFYLWLYQMLPTSCVSGRFRCSWRFDRSRIQRSKLSTWLLRLDDDEKPLKLKEHNISYNRTKLGGTCRYFTFVHATMRTCNTRVRVILYSIPLPMSKFMNRAGLFFKKYWGREKKERSTVIINNPSIP